MADSNTAGINEFKELSKLLPKFHNTELISIIVAGGPAGKVSAAFPGWVAIRFGSTLIGATLRGHRWNRRAA
jgi:hypothetical protein